MASKVIFQMVAKEIDDTVMQRRLVALRRQAVVGIGVDDLGRDFGLASHRVNRHQSPGNLDQFEQFGDRRDLVAFGVDDNLAETNMVRRRPSTDHVNRRLAAGFVVAATERFAIDRNDLAVADILQSGNPMEQTLFEFLRPNESKNCIKPIVRRNPCGQIKILREPIFLGATELRDRHEVIGSTDHRADRDEQNVVQRVDRFTSARIRHFRKVISD